jgi:hypothetical protein
MNTNTLKVGLNGIERDRIYEDMAKTPNEWIENKWIIIYFKDRIKTSPHNQNSKVRYDLSYSKGMDHG